MNRSLSVLAIEYWEKGEREASLRVCDGSFFAEPLFVFTPGQGVGVYYNWTDLRQDPIHWVDYLNAHPEAFDDLERRYLSQCDQIVAMAQNLREESFLKLVELLVDVWPMFGLCSMLGAWDRSELNPGVKKRCFELRAKTDQVFYTADDALERVAREIVGSERVADLALYRFDEINSRQFPSSEEVEQRKKGFVFYQGELSTKPLGQFVKEHDIQIQEEHIEEVGGLSGQCASPGVHVGKVKVVFERRQLWKVQLGDVLVAPMTTPDFMHAIQIAGAIVTDEGGVTCHAAIVARELGKPCIIGTRVATKVLKDDEPVEVDATSGVVRIL